jgi:putative protease
MHPSGNRDITVARMLAEDGSAIAVAPGSGHVVRTELDAALDRALLARYL